MQQANAPKLCLIDASGYIHRAYHALPPLTTSKGEPVHAVYGFSRMMNKILKGENPDYLAVCFDTPKPTFRHDMFVEYKGTRAEIEEALVTQLPLVEALARGWGLPCFKLDGYEADDLIATFAKMGREKEFDVLILSGDKDVFQLVGDHVRVRDEIRKVEYDEERVKSRYGIRPDQLVDYFCLMGDKVDNVSGVPGVGEKTASKLMMEFGSLEKIFENMDMLKAPLREKLNSHKDKVMGNRALIQLKMDVPLDIKWEQLKPQSPNTEVLSSLLKQLEFKGDILGLSEVDLPSDATVNIKRQVRIVWTEQDLKDLTKELSASSFLSYDTETNSLDPLTCHLVGLAVATREDFGWYIPVGHNYIGIQKQLPWETIKNHLQPFFGDHHLLKTGQNLKFDNLIMKRHGMELQGCQFDSMIAAYCLNPSRSSYGLKDMAEEILKEKMTRFEEVVRKPDEGSISEETVEKVAPYAAADAEVVVRLKSIFEKDLKNQGLEDLFYQLEMPLVDVLGEMEAAGIKVDVPYLQNVGREFDRHRKILEEEVYKLAGEEFLLNSPQQLSRILFEKLKLPVIKKTKTGFSTNEDVLRRLSSQHPICEKIISYRELAKLSSTYVDSLIDLVDPSNSRVHTSFHQTGTSTGRLSSSEPNLQNIPIRSELGRQIRRAFVASEDCVLVSADYSQIDLRALAHMSEDPILVATFKSGGDVHTATAAQVFHVPPEKVTAEMRRRAKAINFGIVYGQQAWGLSQSLEIGAQEAQEFINQYFERYAGVKKWIETTLTEARKAGFVTTLAGRKRRVDEINFTNPNIRGFAERVAINTPIQGTSADIIKMAMIHLHRELKEKNLKTLMMVQVHDELLFDVPNNELSVVLPIIKKGMENATALQVPLVADMKQGANWNDMSKIEMEVLA